MGSKNKKNKNSSDEIMEEDEQEEVEIEEEEELIDEDVNSDYDDEEESLKKKKKKDKKDKKKRDKKEKKKRDKKEKKKKKSLDNEQEEGEAEEEEKEEYQQDNNENNENNFKKQINLIKNDSGKRFDEWLIEESKKPIENFNSIISSPTDYFNENILSSQQIEKRNNTAAIASIGDPEIMYGMLQSMEEDYQEIVSFVGKRLNEKKSPFEYIKAVLRSTQGEFDKTQEKRIRGEIIKEFIREFIEYKSNIDEKQLNQCVDILLSECDGINRQSYRDIAETIANSLSTNRRAPILLLLPKSLEQLSFLSTPTTSDADETFKSEIIKSIVESSWNKEIFISIISMFNDLQLNKSELELIVNKIFKESTNLMTDEYISLVHQLILLSSKGLKGRIMSGICELFSNIERREHEKELRSNRYGGPDDDDRNNLNELFCVESIIFQQLNISIKQDNDLAKEFLKLKQLPTQFNIALLMNLSRIPRFKNTAFDTLKNLAINFVKSTTSNTDVFRDTIGSTTKGLDIIVDACVQFGIILLDYNLLVVNDTVKSLRTMGYHLLFDLFSGHQNIREQILDEILCRIIMKSDTINQNWFTLLSHICRNFTAEVRYSKLKESFEYLQHYSTNTVQQLINAFDRIFLIQGNFLNSIIVVLKKSMFAREIEARSAGVTGFIQLLKCLSSDDSMQSNGNSMNQIILEIFSILRRSLTQQESIRTILYQGLIDLIHSRQILSDHIFEILNHQISTYLDLTGNRKSPFDLNKYLELKSNNITGILEPIDKLIYCIQYCIIYKPDQQRQLQQGSSQMISSSQQPNQTQVKDSQQKHDLKIKFQKFLSLLRECSIDSFDFSGKGTEAMTIQCKMLIGVMESLIEYIAMSNEDSISEKFEGILSLFNLYTQLLKKLKENQDELTIRSQAQSKQQRIKSLNGKGKTTKKINDEDEIDDNDNDEENSDENSNKSSSKKKTSSSSSSLSKKTNLTTSNSNNSNIISTFNEFPSLKCLNNLLKIVYTTSTTTTRHKFNRNNSNHFEFLNYIYTTLLSNLNKLYNGIKVLKKTMDKDQLNALFPSPPEIQFRYILQFCMNEIMENEWVSPVTSLPSQNQGSAIPHRKSIHSIALSCIDVIVNYVYENKTEVIMYNIFAPILDNIKLKEYEIKLKEYQDKLNQDNQDNNNNLIEPIKPKPERGHKVIVLIIEQFHKIISKHLFNEYNNDNEMVFNILQNLYKYLTDIDEVKPSFTFLKTISSKNKIESPTLASVILRSIIDMCNKQQSNAITETLSKYVLSLLGSFKSNYNENENENENNGQPPKILALINEKTVSNTINILLSNEESNIDHSKESIVQLKKDWNGGKLSDAENRSLIKSRDSLTSTLNSTILVLKHLSICKINGPPREKFLRVIKKLYTILTSYINMLILFLTNVNDQIKDLIDVSSLLSSNIYDFSEWRGEDSNKKSKTGKLNAVEKARINREAKIMPIITFQLEKYESTVLKYQKKVKAEKIRLGIHFKQVKSREFVIEKQTLLDKMNDEDDNNQDQDNDVDNDNDNHDQDKSSKKKSNTKYSTNISRPTAKSNSKIINKRKSSNNNNDEDRPKKKQYQKKKY